MPQITLNNRLITSSINNNYKFIFFGLILIIYFIWMDIALFVNLQRWSPPPIETPTSITNSDVTIIHHEKNSSNEHYRKNNKIYETRYNYADPFTIFKPLSVKLIMVDHVTHYVHDILARFLADTLHFTRIFPWVTANFVSFAGLAMALLGSRLILSDKLFYCRIGALLFEARNLADSLDGVVYRARKREAEMLKSFEAGSSNPQSLQIGVYQSFYGTFGYNVDVVCDGLGGLFLILAIFIKFLRHPPQKTSSKLLLNTCKLESNSQSGYIYHKLDYKEDKIDSNHECIEMDQYNDLDLIDPNDKCNELKSKKCCDKHKLFIDSNKANIAAAFASNELDSSSSANIRHFSSREVKLVIISFGLRLLFTGLIWDHYVHKYHDLLMVFSNNPTQRRMQGQAFKSIGMWLIMWFWRLGNACAMLEHLTITTFFDKLWDYLYFSSFIGWAYLIVLTLFTQIHYTELYESLNNFAAFT